jgi:hypothetical protein
MFDPKIQFLRKGEEERVFAEQAERNAGFFNALDPSLGM